MVEGLIVTWLHVPVLSLGFCYLVYIWVLTGIWVRDGKKCSVCVKCFVFINFTSRIGRKTFALLSSIKLCLWIKPWSVKFQLLLWNIIQINKKKTDLHCILQQLSFGLMVLLQFVFCPAVLIFSFLSALLTILFRFRPRLADKRVSSQCRFMESRVDLTFLLRNWSTLWLAHDQNGVVVLQSWMHGVKLLPPGYC